MAAGRTGALRLSHLEESKAVYDQWMENLYLVQFLGKDACIDLYGAKTDFEGKDYLLTTSGVEGGEVICSFGREMRPQEWNVLAEVPGDVIRLYKLSPNATKLPRTRSSRAGDAQYYIRGISYPYKKDVVSLFLQETGKKLRRKLTKK